MLARYSRPEMVSIWEEANKFKLFLEIEVLAAEAQGKLGIIPDNIADSVRQKATVDLDRIKEIEQDTGHEIIAFLTQIAEQVGPEARFLHQGLTSSDVLDTCLSLQLTQATDILMSDLEALLEALKTRALEHKMTICMGRSHGIHAEPTSFGLKLLGHYAAFKRCKERLTQAREEIAICKLSGAVGTYATNNPKVEAYVAEKLGLKPESVATQVIPRDRHATFFNTLGLIASCIENLATEIRHLQRTEVREVQEFFGTKQKGSSAMPHKRNPILTENLTGLARMVRSAVVPALENVTLWHERDISHSSVERMIAPDTTCTLDFALVRLSKVIRELIIYPERMKENLESLNGLCYSQIVLLALTQAGVSREDAYKIVQSCAKEVLDTGCDFKEALSSQEVVTGALPGENLTRLFDPAQYLKHVDDIFRLI